MYELTALAIAGVSAFLFVALVLFPAAYFVKRVLRRPNWASAGGFPSAGSICSVLSILLAIIAAMILVPAFLGERFQITIAFNSPDKTTEMPRISETPRGPSRKY